MFHNDSAVVPGTLGVSIIIIMWWVSIWILIEEAILYVSADKRHLKLYVCTLIIIIITLCAHIQPHIISKL